MASELGYRVYRLRRLIGVCLGLVAAGVALGLWLIPGPVTALQIALGAGLFSIFAMAHLAMILIWPTDPGGPVAYAFGTLIMLVVALPAGAYQISSGTEPATLLVISLMLGPFVWLLGAPWLGAGPLWLINRVLPTKQKQVRVFDLPVVLARALDIFAFDPDKQRAVSVHGPVGWDGCFEEAVTRLVADPQTGVLTQQKSVSKVRRLDSDATTRSVMVTTSPETGMTVSVVVHQQFEETPKGTRLTERLDIEGAPGMGMALVMGWLWDGGADSVTAELDADAGHPPRAICHLPLDSMGLAMTRFFKWGDPPIG